MWKPLRNVSIFVVNGSKGPNSLRNVSLPNVLCDVLLPPLDLEVLLPGHQGLLVAVHLGGVVMEFIL